VPDDIDVPTMRITGTSKSMISISGKLLRIVTFASLHITCPWYCRCIGEDRNGDNEVVLPNNPAAVSALNSPESSMDRQSPTASRVATLVPNAPTTRSPSMTSIMRPPRSSIELRCPRVSSTLPTT
jgi:hypothetical protein